MPELMPVTVKFWVKPATVFMVRGINCGALVSAGRFCKGIETGAVWASAFPAMPTNNIKATAN